MRKGVIRYTVVMEGLWPNGKKSRRFFDSPPMDGTVPRGFDKWPQKMKTEYIRPFDSVDRCKAWVGKDDTVLKFELEGRRPLGWYIASRFISNRKYVEGTLVKCEEVMEIKHKKESEVK